LSTHSGPEIPALFTHIEPGFKKLIPAQYHFAGLTGAHGVKALLELVD
jgi:hypothetical protein